MNEKIFHLTWIHNNDSAKFFVFEHLGKMSLALINLTLGTSNTTLTSRITHSIYLRLFLFKMKIAYLTSNSSNSALWWKYACENILYTLLQTDPNLAIDDSFILTLEEIKEENNG